MPGDLLATHYGETKGPDRRSGPCEARRYSHSMVAGGLVDTS